MTKERDGLAGKVHELESRLDELNNDSSHMEFIRKRLAEEMDAERKEFKKTLESRDFDMEHTRKKYQGMHLPQLLARLRNLTFFLAELAQLSEGMKFV